jgi:hypothetical protein
LTPPLLSQRQILSATSSTPNTHFDSSFIETNGII